MILAQKKHYALLLAQMVELMTVKGGMTMPDREKIVKAIDVCLGHGKCNDCSYHSGANYSDQNCRGRMLKDVLALLKEQDPVKPHYNARTNWYECGACHYSMTSGMHCRGELIPAYKANYCAKCGRAVKWNDR